MKQMEADVVVVAGGSSGLSAALAAAEAGASVIVFEKASTTGGAGNMAFGPFAVGSRLQRLKQIGFSNEDAFKMHMEYTHWRVNAQLVKAWIDKSPTTIDWLERMGVEFLDVGCHNPGFPFTWHIIKSMNKDEERPGNAGAAMRVMTERAKKIGVKFCFRTAGKKLIRKGRSIGGVLAEDESGEKIQANASAVVLATGGFGDSPDMIKKYTPFIHGKTLYSTRIPGATGDGMKMAWEAGAASSQMIIHLTPPRVPDLDDFDLGAFVFRQAGLIVNQDGERFMNEEAMDNPTHIGNALAVQKDGCGYLMFDENALIHYETVGLDTPLDGVGAVLMPNVNTATIRPTLAKGNKNVFAADSLEQMVEQTGMNKDNLIKTIEEYNRFCDTGYDARFHKHHKFLRPVKQPKFYAARLFPGSVGTLGGLKCNHRLEVTTPTFESIPGLYAAGYEANSTHGDSYAYCLPGGTLGFAINSGRIAGENAAIFAKSLQNK
jgi:fumarate reductase flavoprotein subunit